MIAGIVGVLALCVLMALAGFAIGRATTSEEVVASTAESVAAQDSVDEEEAATAAATAAQTAEETASTAPTETNNEEANTDSASAPDTPAPDPTEPAAQPARVPAEDVAEIDLDVFYEAWAFIQDAYDGDIPPNEDILQALINGSIESLDDEFTRYIEPDVAARLREDMSGSVSGIGAFVRENDDGFFEIVAPIEGQPADLAGLKPGDLIIGVDGEDVIGISFDEVILLVRGEEGTAVTLSVARQGEAEPLEFTIIRARFDIPVVQSEMLDDNIAYVQLTEFSRDAGIRLEEAVAELLKENPTGMILDLRNNPGGFLDESIAIGDLFLDDGVVLFERNADGLDRTFRSNDGDIGEAIPLVVLVNGGSASASEIVAGAIQDTGRGILIGTTTFGKGSVQTVHGLSDGSELRVTIARWYTPADHSIDKEGITPDIEVEFPLDTPEDEDPQLDRAIEYLVSGE
jgi:carboxyl-terminal processing protease